MSSPNVSKLIQKNLMPILSKIALIMIARSENQIGVTFDYIRHMAKTDFGLLMRYNKMFSIIDPRKHVSAEAYHAARMRGALAADCWTCVEVEINLAKQSGLSSEWIDEVLAGSSSDADINAVITLTDATVRDRVDASKAREIIRSRYGEKGLIELSIAMNGTAMLPGVKRAMGYATACNIELMRAAK
jgi:hypothetical protein